MTQPLLKMMRALSFVEYQNTMTSYCIYVKLTYFMIVVIDNTYVTLTHIAVTLTYIPVSLNSVV